MLLAAARAGESMDEFRVEKSLTGYRVALYRHDRYYVTFVDGITLPAATRQAHSLTELWQRIRSSSYSAAVPRFEQAS
jgi:hypothetical protein